LLPFIVDTIAVLYFDIFRSLQIVPAVLMLTSFIMIYTIFRHHVLDIIPLSRSIIMDQTSDLTLVFDARERLLDYNQSAHKVLELTPSDMGVSKEAFFQKKLQASTLLTSPSSEWQKDQDTYLMEERPLKDRFSGFLGTLYIFKKITLQKKAEKELKSIIEMKTRLIALMSHDLQGNLANVSLLADHLKTNNSKLSPEEIQTQTENIAESARSCIQFTDEILHWSKIQITLLQPAFEALHLDSLLQDVLSFLQPVIIQKNLEIEIDPTPEQAVYADRKLLLAIFRNLLSNAIRYTPEDGKILIRFQKHEQEIQITIADTGIGIAPEKLSSLFDFQSSSNQRLGLFLCQDFIQQLGGRLWAESQPGEGSQFHFKVSMTQS
jgi:signal transduction histidine kinase